MSDRDGYPTDDELRRIEEWRIGGHGDCRELLAFAKSLWRWPERQWRQSGIWYSVSTGGWSGNEELVGALRRNAAFWGLVWYSSRVGGHHTFEVPGRG